MLKVVTIVGTRPELIKMSRVIAEFDKHTRHVLVHTGQNYDYELNQIFSTTWGYANRIISWRPLGKAPRKPSAESSKSPMRCWKRKIRMP